MSTTLTIEETIGTPVKLEKPHKPGILHRIGLCYKVRKGYTCHGRENECK